MEPWPSSTKSTDLENPRSSPWRNGRSSRPICPRNTRLITEVLYWSAGRIGEVLSIRVRNLAPDTALVILERQTTKTKTTREVYPPEVLMNQLLLRARSLRLQPTDVLFFNQSPQRPRNPSGVLSRLSPLTTG